MALKPDKAKTKSSQLSTAAGRGQENATSAIYQANIKPFVCTFGGPPPRANRFSLTVSQTSPEPSSQFRSAMLETSALPPCRTICPVVRPSPRPRLQQFIQHTLIIE